MHGLTWEWRLNFHFRRYRFGALLHASFLLGFGVSAVLHADEPQAVLQSDRALLLAFKNSGRETLASLLDSNFNWINSKGVRLTRNQVLADLPAVANSDIQPEAHVYGSSPLVRSNRAGNDVLRVWIRRCPGWWLLQYSRALSVP